MTDFDEKVAEIWARSSGPEFVLAIADGTVARSPVLEHIGLNIVDARHGYVELSWEPPAHIANRAGIVHGGYLSIVLDEAAGIACGTLGEHFRPHLTTNLNVEFIRPVLPGVPHRAIGEVVKDGKTRIISDGRVLDPEGRLVARAAGNFIPNRTFQGPPGFTHTS